MSQVHFAQVTSWEGTKTTHERFVTDYDAQPHWAHRKRDGNRLSPAEVLGRETTKISSFILGPRNLSVNRSMMARYTHPSMTFSTGWFVFRNQRALQKAFQ